MHTEPITHWHTFSLLDDESKLCIFPVVLSKWYFCLRVCSMITSFMLNVANASAFIFQTAFLHLGGYNTPRRHTTLFQRWKFVDLGWRRWTTNIQRCATSKKRRRQPDKTSTSNWRQDFQPISTNWKLLIFFLIICKRNSKLINNWLKLSWNKRWIHFSGGLKENSCFFLLNYSFSIH